MRSNQSIPLLVDFIRDKISDEGGEEKTEEDNYTRYDFSSALSALDSIGTSESEETIEKLVEEFPQLRHIKELIDQRYYCDPPLRKTIPEIIELAKEWEKNRDYSILIRGSSVLAEALGRGKDQVRDIDVFVVENQRLIPAEELQVKERLTIKDLEKELPREDVERIKEWIRHHGYEGKRIDLVYTDNRSLRQNDVYIDEPEAVLYDAKLDSLARIVRPVSKEERNTLERSFSLGEEYFSDQTSPSQHERIHLPTLLDVAERLNRYQQGRLIEGRVPETLVPNGSSARVLRCLDISERFGIPADAVLLDEIEKDAENGVLEISPTFPQGVYGYNHIQRGIDETFVKLAFKKDYNRLLQKRYPQLWGVLNGVREAGGSLEDFIRKEYGEAYLELFRKYGRSFHLYDVKLGKSPASFEEQREFLATWDTYIERSVHFGFRGLEKMDDNTELPECLELDRLIDKKELKKRLKGHGKRIKALRKLTGRYSVEAGSAESVGVKEKIDALLKVYHLDWVDITDRSKGNLTRQLIRLGVHPRNPILRELDNTEGHHVELIISQEPKAILQASTGKPWTSCVKLEQGGGGQARGLYEDVENGTAIAYFVNDKKFVGRVLIRAARDEEDRIVAVPEDYYGDERYAFIMSDALQKIIEEKSMFPETESMTVYSFPTAWSDQGERQRLSNKLCYRAYPKRRLPIGGEGVGQEHIATEEEEEGIQRNIELQRRIVEEGLFVHRHGAA